VPSFARLNRLLRRRGRTSADGEVLRYDDLELVVPTQEVRRAGRRIELTQTEFRLLELFLRNPARVLDRALIAERVWGFDFGSNSNSMNVYIGYLRRKTEAAGEPRLIHTKRGVGYILRRHKNGPEQGS
jgi:two-component system response regulator MprA